MSGFKPDNYQKDFCEDSDKAIRLLAPAGSGKTQSLLWRCMRVLKKSKGENQKFLILTFTTVAKKELEERVKRDPSLQELHTYLDITTLNAWGWRRLKQTLHSPQLIKEPKHKYSLLHNTLQPIWHRQKYEILKDIISSKKGSSRAFISKFFEIMDGFKVFGFRHDMDEESYFSHCSWLRTKKLDRHFDALVVSKLKEIEIIESDVDYGTKRLLKDEGFFLLFLACQECIDSNPVCPSKSDIEDVVKRKFCSDKLTKKVSRYYDDLSIVFRRKDIDIEEMKKNIERYIKQGLEKSECRKWHRRWKSKEDSEIDEIYKVFFPFWKDVIRELQERSHITYDDQKYWCYIDLENKIKKNKYPMGKNRYTHVMVDEFQDVNLLDLKFLKAIAEYNKTELTIVGDDDQSIYEWRGAIPDFILDPKMHVYGNGNFRTHIFENNYRSPKNIVGISQRLIKNNKRRIDKNIKAVSAKSADIEIEQASCMQEGIGFVLDQINKVKKEDNSLAIIGRTKSQIVPYQIVFAKENISFYAAEDLQIFLSEAFEELQQVLRIKENIDRDPVRDLVSICNKIKRYPIKRTEMVDLNSYFGRKKPATTGEAIEYLRSYEGKLKGGNSGKFADIVEGFYSSDTVSETIEYINENFEGFRKDFGKSLDDIFYTGPPFYHLSEYARSYASNYGDFIEHLGKAKDTLSREHDPLMEEVESDDNDNWRSQVHLMTALRAKGKEFDNVVVLDSNKGIWPNRFAEEEEQLEQERRLFYVAVTRARNKLSFIVNDKLDNETALPSPYLSEMGLL